MRIKTDSLIISFPTTTDAMKMEKYCMEHQISGRLIPIPREITAGCGLAWKALPEQRAQLLELMETANIKYEAEQILFC